MEEVRNDESYHLIMGNIMVAREDLTTSEEDSTKKVIIPKGSKAIVGFDNRLYLFNGSSFGLDESVEISGYSANGLAEYIYDRMSHKIPLDEMLESYEISKDNFTAALAFTLTDIGMGD